MNATSVAEKVDLYFAISNGYTDRLKIDSAIFYANKIRELSEKPVFETGIGKYHLALSGAQSFRNLHDVAEANILKAIEIFTRNKEILLLGLAHRQWAILQHLTNDIFSSKKNFWAAIHYLKASGDVSYSFKAYFWLSRIYYQTSDIDSAAFYGVKALEMAEQLNQVDRIYQAGCTLGRYYLALGDASKSVKYFNYGFRYFNASSDKVSHRNYLKEYANGLILIHDFSRADSTIKEIEALNNRFNDVYGRITLDKINGIMAYERGKYKEALNFMQKAYGKRDEIKTNTREVKDITFFLGKTEYETHDYDNAIQHLQSTILLSRQVMHLPDEMHANFIISRAFERKNNVDSALFYFQRYSILKDSLFSAQKQKSVIEISTRYETEKKEQAIRFLEKESETNSYLLQLKNKQIETQHMADEQKSQQLILVSKQNEINKLDALQKTLSLENERKESEKKQDKLLLLERDGAYQKLLAAKQSQQNKIVYVSIVAILLLTGYGVNRFMRRKKIQNQQEVLNERLRISRELHDELGSTLSGIIMYSHLTREQINGSKTVEVERSLNQIHESAGDMVNKLSDIVWLENPEKDSLQILIERVEEYATKMAMSKNIQININLQDMSDINLPIASRRNIYLFCKEAINNAVKYSNASALDFTMKLLNHKKIAFIIKDNGKGFDIHTVKKGNGLVNMEQRAKQINGEFQLESNPGHGTRLSLICKIT